MKRAAANLREHPLVKRVDSLIRQWDGELDSRPGFAPR